MLYFVVVVKILNFCFNYWIVILVCNNLSFFKYYFVFIFDLNILYENWNDSIFYNLIFIILFGFFMEGVGEVVLSLFFIFWYLIFLLLNLFNSFILLFCKV